MKEYRIRVKYTAMKWHIHHYQKLGWETIDIESTPHGKIKMAVFKKGDEKIILQPKVQQRFLSEEARKALAEGNIHCHTFREEKERSSSERKKDLKTTEE